jgi:predicted membrane channel-forming protein YqfA (hemolysin III family)
VPAASKKMALSTLEDSTAVGRLMTFVLVNERARYNHFFWHLFVPAGSDCHSCTIFF